MKKFVCVLVVFAGLLADIAAQDVAVFPQLGHIGVNSVVFNPDGKTIVSGAFDGTVKLWDVNTGREIRTFRGHSEGVNSVAFSPDGKTIVSGSTDETVKLWNVATGREIRTFRGHSGGVNSVAFTPDGKTIVSGAYDSTVKLWDVNTGREIRTFRGHSEGVNSVAFSPDGKTIVSGSTDETVKLWNVATGKEIRTLSGHSELVGTVAFSPDGKTIVSGSGCIERTMDLYTGKLVPTGMVKLWDVATGKELRTFSGHSDAVWSVAFSPDSKTIVSGSRDKTVKLWDAATGREIRTILGHFFTVYSVAFNYDGKTVVSGSWDGTIRLWDVITGREINILSGRLYRIHSMAFSSDGKTVASGATYEDEKSDDKIELWDIVTGRKIRMLSGHSELISSVAFSPDGKTLVSGSYDGTVKLWDVNTGREIHTFRGHSEGVNSVAFSPDSKTIVSSSINIKLWDAVTGREIHTMSDRFVHSVAFSPDGKTIASEFSEVKGSFNEEGSYIVGGDVYTVTIKLWDVITGREIRTLSGHSGGVLFVPSIAFSPDGKTIVSGSTDGMIDLWDVVTGREIHTLRGNSWAVKSVAFSPDGKTIVSGSEDNTIKLWDVVTGREIRTISEHSGWVNAVTFINNGKRILSGSYDGTIRLWDVSTGKEIASFIGFSGNDSQLISATRDITAAVEEAASSIDSEWIVITPDGYYAASPRGDRYLNVRINNTVTGIDSFRSIFYNPDVVRARLAGEPDPPSKKSVTIQQAAAFMPPDVSVQTQTRASSSSSATISVSITDKNLPLKNIIVMVNGRRLGREELSATFGATGLQPSKASINVTGDQKTLNFTLPVNLDPGDNRIEVVAFNGSSENRRYVDVIWDAPAGNKPKLPDLWILAIGVNKYDNAGEQLGNLKNLDYCVADARGVIDSLKAQEGIRYGKVHSLLIADNAQIQPTTENIRKNLTFLEGAGPKDVALLFLAGHGVSAAEGKFYFLPKDAVVTKGNNVTVSRAISGDEIVAVLDAPGNRLVFIDACKSGGVDNDRMVRLFMDTNAFVFTACRGNESSLELPNLGHGVFTYSVMDALKGAAGARAADNVSVKSMSGFVQIDVSERTGNRQHPSAYSLGFYDFPITVVK